MAVLEFVAEPAIAPHPSRPAAVHKPVSSAQRFVVAGLVIIPFLGAIAAGFLLWGRWVTALDLALLATFYVLTGLGVTLGFHRLFTHRGFETVRPIRYLLEICGAMAAQGPPLIWVAVHRQHHQHSDEELDPHSPHAYGTGIAAIIRGFLHAHVGWMMKLEHPDLDRYAPDLNREKTFRRISNLFPVWVMLGFALPALIGGLISQSWFGALTGFIWGGLVRMFLVHHLTWSVNSVCHLWGQRHFNSSDESRNNFLMGLLAFGEGWHNNHHAFPTSARHGLLWWQFDVTYIVIRALSLVGLAWRVRLPSPESLAAQRT
ncbi:MAG: fatty acid desaturase [Phycisphaerae bacterium]